MHTAMILFLFNPKISTAERIFYGYKLKPDGFQV